MDDQEPGFGPQGIEWVVFGFGVLLILLGAMGGIMMLAGEDVGPSFGGLLVGGLVLTVLSGSYIWNRRKEERATPPPSRAELTSIALHGIGATRAELEANRQGQITPAQWRRLRRQIVPKSVVQGTPAVLVATGPVEMSRTFSRTLSTDCLRIDGVQFTGNQGGYDCFRQHISYRIFYVEFPAHFVNRAFILSAEAITDQHR